jgi:hypothetical protein
MNEPGTSPWHPSSFVRFAARARQESGARDNICPRASCLWRVLGKDVSPPTLVFHFLPADVNDRVKGDAAAPLPVLNIQPSHVSLPELDKNAPGVFVRDRVVAHLNAVDLRVYHHGDPAVHPTLGLFPA